MFALNYVNLSDVLGLVACMCRSFDVQPCLPYLRHFSILCNYSEFEDIFGV